jgi:hypothetical protein
MNLNSSRFPHDSSPLPAIRKPDSLLRRLKGGKLLQEDSPDQIGAANRTPAKPIPSPHSEDLISPSSHTAAGGSNEPPAAPTHSEGKVMRRISQSILLFLGSMSSNPTDYKSERAAVDSCLVSLLKRLGTRRSRRSPSTRTSKVPRSEYSTLQNKPGKT